ncbi:hypothetical protein EDD86DRAFT_187832 [Gorgonomyces haynaldii]|nr:hypothetical protein EDD86DRAFT_187832 [Gorgonomyces haynaldii]
MAKRGTFVGNTSFISIQLDCSDPPGDSNGVMCQKALNALKRAATRIERVVHLPNKITIQASFKSFCSYPLGTPLGTPCYTRDNVLGYAAPSSWHQFTPERAQQLGLSPDYLYPISLARQYEPNADQLFGTGADISASFNSDFNWWFATQTDSVGNPTNGNWGPGVTINGGFFNQANYYSYDLEQVALHEFIHGLGFLSSWSNWIDDYTFVPSWIDRNQTGFEIGLAPPFIYTRLMADQVNHVWLSVWADLISASIKQSIQERGTQWRSVYNQSVGAKIGNALMNGLFQTPQGLYLWYPSSSGLQPVALYAPVIYEPGSSISHFDTDTYLGGTEYLMRPTARSGAGLDAFIPGAKNGPLGTALLGILRSMGYVILVN